MSRKRCKTPDRPNYHYSHIESRRRTFDWYRKWWSWMTLNCATAVIFHYSTKFGSSGPNTSKWLV